MKYFIGLVALALVLSACGLLSPAEQGTALEVIDQMLKNGVITLDQYEGLREAILAKGSGVWWEELAKIVVGAGLAYAGVQIRRGPPTQKVGLPASKIHPASPATP